MATDFKSLPLEGLNKLLFGAVEELLTAMDKKDLIAIRIKKKLVEILLQAIAEKTIPAALV